MPTFDFFKITFLLLVLSTTFRLFSQATFSNTPSQNNQVEIEHFSVEQGLSDRIVSGIERDQQGFLWIATRNGLNRFDGYEFLVFDNRSKNPNQISFNQITQLLADRQGNLFIIPYELKDAIDLLDPVSGKNKTLKKGTAGGFKGDRILLSKSRNGQVWLLTFNGKNSVVHRFDEAGRRFVEVFAGLPFPTQGVDNLSFVPAMDGSFWVAYHSGGLSVIYHTDGQGRILDKFDNNDFSPPLPPFSGGLSLHETSRGDIWLNLRSMGIFQFDPAQRKFRLHPKLPTGDFTLREDQVGNWLFYQPAEQQAGRQLYLFTAAGQLLDYGWLLAWQGQINCVFSEDFATWLLVGTSDGLKKIRLKPSSITTYLAQDLGNLPFGISMRGISPDGQGNVLFATELNGIYELNLASGALRKPSENIPALKSLGGISYVRNLVLAGDSVVWIAHKWGLRKYNPKQKTTRNYEDVKKVEAIALQKNGGIWMVTGDYELVHFDPATGASFVYKNKDGSNPMQGCYPDYLLETGDSIRLAERKDSSPGCYPNYLLEASNGILWAGTNGGLVRINTAAGESVRYTADSADPGSLGSNNITCIYEDGKGQLWLGTLGGGLNIFDPETGKVVASYTTGEGLSNNNVAGIIPAGKPGFWITTYGGISFFDPQEKTFRNFYQTDGLSHNEMNRFSFYRDTVRGRCYFGGMNGVNIFDEKELLKTDASAPLLISEISFSDGKKLLAQYFGNFTDSTITLPPDNRSLYLRLALANYAAPSRNRFSYRLEGVDKDWNYLSGNREIRFSYLPAGEHTLRLRGADSQGNWSGQELALRLVVVEFWYKRWWAWLLFALLLAAAAWYAYCLQLGRKLEHAETLRLQELDAFKSRFFTNITHEFRTPLTVILGMAEKLESSGGVQPAANAVSLIKRNGQNLLRLINQILDLAKLESNTLKINYVQGDVLPYLRYIAESLHSLANAQNVMLRVESKEPEIVMDYDPERLLQIVHNLLSNAIKFTPSGGRVTLRGGVNHGDFKNHHDLEKHLFLNVSDTGTGIPPEDLPHIFDRFFQANTPPLGGQGVAKAGGTGIGLSLTKELVKAMGGEISVESEVGKGTTFTVRLPISNKATASDGVTSSHPVTSEIAAPLSFPKGTSASRGSASRDAEVPFGNDKGAVLLIEDNPDVVEYLAACLGEQYQLDFAYNGRAGIEKALETIPDLIVSDVMMPEKDGFEVCDFLKNDQRTSHIPIVLLTAKADVESRIAGLKRGADAYLAKPFHQEELQVTLANLLEIRRKLQTKYVAAALAAGASGLAANSSAAEAAATVDLEDEFLRKLKTILEKDLSDANLGLSQIERKMGMSQAQFFRKMKALTGRTPALFIRSFRLQRGMELLRTTNKNVSEISYEVGFSDPAYFSRTFSEEFGMTPTEVRK